MSRLTQVPNSPLSRISLTGLSPSAAALSRGVLLSVAIDFVVRSFYPGAALPQPPVWAPARSLAATSAITVVFFSSG